MVEQPITSGLLKGKTINMHLIDRAGNETSPLFSIADQRRSRMVVDFEENKVMFKDKPDEWHTLPVTRKGLMMIPLTNEACERHLKPQSAEPPPPPSPPTKDTRRRKLMKKVARKAIAQFSPARACCVEEERQNLEQCEDPVRHRDLKSTDPESLITSEQCVPPSTGKWIQKEISHFQKQLHVDIAMLLKRDSREDGLGRSRLLNQLHDDADSTESRAQSRTLDEK